MRRDYITLDVRNTDRAGEQRPTAVLTFDGPTEVLEERLVGANGEPPGRENVDVAFRFRTEVGADDARGVFSVANRITGEFLLEVNGEASAVLELVGTARRDDGGDGQYRVVVREDDETVAVYEKETLLVYDEDGSLLRQHSLIPSGVEL